MKTLYFECAIDILGHSVGVKIYKNEDGMFTFEQSHYLQDESQMDVYKPGSGAISDSLEGIVSKIKFYKSQVHIIKHIKPNPSF